MSIFPCQTVSFTDFYDNISSKTTFFMNSMGEPSLSILKILRLSGDWTRVIAT